MNGPHEPKTFILFKTGPMNIRNILLQRHRARSIREWALNPFCKCCTRRWRLYTGVDDGQVVHSDGKVIYPTED